MYIGLVGAFIFILIQLILLVDFAHSWNSAWVSNMENTGSKIWAVMLLFCTFLMYGASIAGIVCLYVYYTQSTKSSCHTNKFFVSFNLILCIVASLFAIHPKVQEKLPTSGMCVAFMKLQSNLLLQLPLINNQLFSLVRAVFKSNKSFRYTLVRKVLAICSNNKEQ